MENVDYDEMPPLEDHTAATDDEIYSCGFTVKKGGLNLNELRSDKETEFEIDFEDNNDDGLLSNTYATNEDLLENLNTECSGSSTASDANRKNLSPFEAMAIGMQDISGDGGVLKQVTRKGSGPVVSNSSVVRVHYNSYLEYSDEPFDSSRLRGKQLRCKLGEGCIVGWDLSIATMQKSEISRFLVKSEYAYRQMGIPPRIPPDATVLFEIELVDFVDETAAEILTQQTEKEKKSSKFEDIYRAADSLRKVGNDAFVRKQMRNALIKYTKASRLLECANLKDEQDQQLMEELLIKLYLNLSLCSLNLDQYKEAKRFSSKVLEIQKDNVKAHYRKGKACLLMKDFDLAKRHLLSAANMSPSDEDITREIKLLNTEVSNHKAKEKELFKKIFA